MKVLKAMGVAGPVGSVGSGVVDGAEKLLHEVKIIDRNKVMIAGPMFFNCSTFPC